MGREVRRVPANWQHPKNERGVFIPLFDGARFATAASDWDEGQAQWNAGYVRNYRGPAEWKPRDETIKETTYAGYAGERPREQDHMPAWSESERTHWMMYEDTSEGTPISPAFATPEELAFWLAENSASAFAGTTATYEQWLATIHRGFACSAVVLGGVMVSGVEAMAEPIDRD